MTTNRATHIPPRLLTVSEVADYLNVSRRTVERIIARGDLKPLRAGRYRRFRLSDIDTYLEGGTTTYRASGVLRRL